MVAENLVDINNSSEEELRWVLANKFVKFRESCPNSLHKDSECSDCCGVNYIPKNSIDALLTEFENLEIYIGRNIKGIRKVTAYPYWGGEYFAEGDSLELAVYRAIVKSLFDPDLDEVDEEDNMDG